MSHKKTHLPEELGQTAVLFALMIIGLVLFVGLAVDGGNVLNERRITQNAADSAALTGMHYIEGTDAPTEERLLEVINGVVQANGVPDTDEDPDNSVNDNITVHYTDFRGNRLETQDCWTAPCGYLPSPTEGLEVVITHDVNTFLVSLAGRDVARVGAKAIAVVEGGLSGSPDIGENAMIALGDQCEAGDRPLDFSGYYADVIGDLHSNSYFENRGDENHYHGQVTYAEGIIDSADVKGVYEPAHAMTENKFEDPLGFLTVDAFDCSSGSIGSNPDLVCHDLTGLPKTGPPDRNRITTKVLVDNGYLDKETGWLEPGIYYAKGHPFFIGWDPDDPESSPADNEIGMQGNVTLVTDKYIKITERDVQLTGYMPDFSEVPGLLMYSGLEVAEESRCTEFQFLEDEELPINTTGNTGTRPPKVWHAGEYDPDRDGADRSELAECFDHTDPSKCYELGSLQYIGIIYAPGGKAATSGHGASYVGAVIADSIRINGFVEYEDIYDCGGASDPCRPYAVPEVGVLFVHDPNLLRPDERLISLER